MTPIRSKDLFVKFHQDEAYRAAHERLATQLILARNVVRRRAELGLSQDVLAKAAGMRQPRIADLEGGKSNPTLETLERIAKALNTTPDRLIRADPGADGYDDEPVMTKAVTVTQHYRTFDEDDLDELVILTKGQAAQPRLVFARHRSTNHP